MRKVDITNLVRAIKLSSVPLVLITTFSFFILFGVFALLSITINFDDFNHVNHFRIGAFSVLLLSISIPAVKYIQSFSTPLVPISFLLAPVSLLLYQIFFRENFKLFSFFYPLSLAEWIYVSIFFLLLLPSILTLVLAPSILCLLPFQINRYTRKKTPASFRSAIYSISSLDPFSFRTSITITSIFVFTGLLTFLGYRALELITAPLFESIEGTIINPKFRDNFFMWTWFIISLLITMITKRWVSVTSFILSLICLYFLIDFYEMDRFYLAASKIDGSGMKFMLAFGCFILAIAVVYLYFLEVTLKLVPRRFLKSNSESIVADLAQSPGLFLREFKADQQRVKTSFSSLRKALLGMDYVGLENIAALEMAWRRPMIALTNPHITKQPLGVIRVEAEENSWMEDVKRHIRDCEVVCVCLGNTDNLKWEFEQILSGENYRKLVILFPHDYPDKTLLFDLSPELAKRLKLKSAKDEREVLSRCLTICFDPELNEFMAVTCEVRDSVAYREAIRIALDTQSGKNIV